MDIWFLSDPKRLQVERTAITELQESSEWLIATDWSLCGKDLGVDAVIRAHGYDYSVRLVYPKLFPRIPAVVRPVGATDRWSEHQYGITGALCLEWGPDNWHDRVTGAELLESAYKLLDIENPLGNEAEDNELAEKLTAPSRHFLALGQGLRNEPIRFFISREALAAISSSAEKTRGRLRFTFRNLDDTFLAIVHQLDFSSDGNPWSDPTVPEYLKKEKGNDIREGVFFVTMLTGNELKKIGSAATLVDLLHASGFTDEIVLNDGKVHLPDVESVYPSLLIIDSENNPHFFLPLSENKPLQFASVCGEQEIQVDRRPKRLAPLADKSIGIVGSGSLGSKVALSLARMGFRKFFLIDYDMMLPENVQRHGLDWDAVGEHKVDGLKNALEKLGSGFEIEVSRIHLTGQENVAIVATDLNRLGRCDLIVDATAAPDVFNLLATVASTSEKPLVWGEVYGGGVGGFVARSRPTIDPDALVMRLAYLGFCERNPAPVHLRAARDYGSESHEKTVRVASDADVSIIAHHLARLAADTALSNETSEYPYSMYLIGLAKEWVFEAPFSTVPVATDHLVSSEPDEADGPQISGETLEFLTSLMEKKSAAGSSS